MTPRAPEPRRLADACTDLARRLHDTGTATVDMARILAARGWSTGHEGASTAYDPDHPEANQQLTSVEAGADRPGPWVGIDDDLAVAMHQLWVTLDLVDRLMTKVGAHADRSSAGRVQRYTGAGFCLACARDVPGIGHDRLKGGDCPACYTDWLRAREAGETDRTVWRRRRTIELADTVTA